MECDWFVSFVLNKTLIELLIVNCRTHLKFPEEVKLSPEAKDLICKLLCNVEKGSKPAHPWFKGI
ncbi:putative non-specific serine/threonine protein kinase [Helianthus annuus]|nr:putative non-specific serine/threonine protein kinase [Helianthus annuus]